jgi:hypothetical protein
LDGIRHLVCEFHRLYIFGAKRCEGLDDLEYLIGELAGRDEDEGGRISGSVSLG